MRGRPGRGRPVPVYGGRCGRAGPGAGGVPSAPGWGTGPPAPGAVGRALHSPGSGRWTVRAGWCAVRPRPAPPTRHRSR
ncbi:hypothetical protein B7R87_00210 [Streptomyces tsukubensis]|nr:hypothetical protein B7R87_00210 [Streptomyces tsukubensis]